MKNQVAKSENVWAPIVLNILADALKDMNAAWENLKRHEELVKTDWSSRATIDLIDARISYRERTAWWVKMRKSTDKLFDQPYYN